MRIEYNEELRMIKDEILRMSAMTEKMLSDSVAALKSQDCELARSVIDRDDLVDAKEIELQLVVSQVIATQGPVATDLRRLASTYKIITNLERIADLAVNISKRVLELSEVVYMKRLVDIPRACELAEKLLKLAIAAFVHEDISRLREVVDMEDEIDALNIQIHHECLAYMMDNSKISIRARYLFSSVPIWSGLVTTLPIFLKQSFISLPVTTLILTTWMKRRLNRHWLSKKNQGHGT
ncbi:phosphate transport system regulatory protein PhoU [Acetobacterium wieringae]|nr:PhoU domain-containing protein [Acetobacterium wieringae]URN85538.1 phosphate transport system regulatory protein PhoU [Acetobacterium wieringae]